MDRVSQRHNAAKAFMDHWMDNQQERDLRALKDLPCHVALEDDLIGDVVADLAMLHPGGANVIVVSEIGDDGFKAAAIHMAPRRGSANRSKDEPIPVDPSISMGMLLVLLGSYRKVLLAVKEYSCAPKVTELVSA
ncbi:MAG: hypothetical protein KTV68_17485 [Acidimicrobiia bacterium]|nr:hypothetical protein [Acidimicrobiia bacterium]